MLKISKKSEYGIIALKHLLNQAEGIFSRSKEIAGFYNIPSEVLAKILQTLVRGGLVRSIQGAHGGYVLAKSGNAISLSEIIECIEGPVGIVDCVVTESDPRDCVRINQCNISDPFKIIQKQFIIFLSRITLADINNENVMQYGKW